MRWHGSGDLRALNLSESKHRTEKNIILWKGGTVKQREGVLMQHLLCSAGFEPFLIEVKFE
jgi:hypothetical protein